MPPPFMAALCESDVIERRQRDRRLAALSRFQYLYVGLPGLDGVEYAKGDNWLGVALSVLMKIPPDRVAW
ncbi:MAG: hypothetical protein PHN77_21720, partial [Thermoguttaceae bacterium]|nr:hypothetical protein [Thermoguttaceae bacterium]